MKFVETNLVSDSGMYWFADRLNKFYSTKWENIIYTNKLFKKLFC